MSNVFLIVLLLTGGMPGGPSSVGGDDPDGWRLSLGFTAGWSFAPAEIGRDINATGGEALIARLGDGPLVGLRFGLENGPVSFELELAGHAEPIEVENEFGTCFPNHGRRPFRYTVAAALLPLAPLRGTDFGRHVRPFLRGGAGGWILSVDLDNVNDQSWYNLWTRSLGAGVRVFPGGEEFFVELRFERSWVSGRGPIVSFRTDAVTVAIGAMP